MAVENEGSHEVVGMFFCTSAPALAMTVLASKQHDEEVVEHLCQPRRML
jgi:hypothetical protein